MLAVKAPATEAALAQLAPHLARGRLRALGAERAQRDRHRARRSAPSAPWAASSISAPTGTGPGRSCSAIAAPSWSARSTARSATRTREMHALLASIRARRGAHRQHLGLSVGQARLRRDAVRDRADRRLRWRRISPIRGASSCSITLGREVIAVAAARGVKPVGFKEFDPAAFAPDAAPTSVARSHRGARRVHEPWRQDPFRHLARPCGAQAQDRGRSADRRSSARSAREAGIATPAIDRLVALIHDIEDGRRPLSFETFQDLIDTCTSATMAASRS